jgi:AAA ATPase domain
MTGTVQANPFGETIVSDYFVGRDDELGQFRANLNGLRNGNPNHEFVAGLEGTGKSYYLHKLCRIASGEGFFAVVLTADLGVTAHQQVATILGRMIDEIELGGSTANGPPQRTLRNDWDAGAGSKLFRHCRQDSLIIDNVHQDFRTLAIHVTNTNRSGVVICLDEGQRIEPIALSALKNALQALSFFQVVLALRLSSDSGGAIEAGRRLLIERVIAAEQDMGTARFFVTGTGMGPFRNDEEVRRFFKARLGGNAIQFDDETVVRIGEICDRVPGRMNQLAERVYNRALREGIVSVALGFLNDSFDNAYPVEIRQAVDLVAELSEDLSNLLRRLCDFVEPTSAEYLINRAYPGLPEEIRTALAEGEAKRLNDLGQQFGVVQGLDGKYSIANSLQRYALKRALKLA